MNKKIVLCLVWSVCVSTAVYSRNPNEGLNLQIEQPVQQHHIALQPEFGSQEWLDELKVVDQHLLELHAQCGQNPENQAAWGLYVSSLTEYIGKMVEDIWFVWNNSEILNEFDQDSVNRFANVIAEHQQFLSSPPHVANLPRIGIPQYMIDGLVTKIEQLDDILRDNLENESDEENENGD